MRPKVIRSFEPSPERDSQNQNSYYIEAMTDSKSTGQEYAPPGSILM